MGSKTTLKADLKAERSRIETILRKETNMENKAYKRKLEGVVCSSKSDKTIVVSVVRRYKHPKYSKFVNFSKKYHAHDYQ